METSTVDISSYKIVNSLSELKKKQMEQKKQLRRRQQSISLHQPQTENKQIEDHSLDQIRKNYQTKLKAIPKLDCYQRLKGYLQLQDLEIKRVRNNSNQPTFGTLYPQVEQDNRLSSFLVGESPMRRNYGNNRYQSESPARLIQDQAIPELYDYLKDRKIRKLMQNTKEKKEVEKYYLFFQLIEQKIQEIENKKFQLHEFYQDNRPQSIQDIVKQQVPKFIPQKYNANVNVKRLNTEKQYKSSDELPMTMLKDKLLSDNIKSTGEMYSSINPLQLQLYSITDNILQFHQSKQKHNQYLVKALQKCDHNRRQTLFHKHLLYNQKQKTQQYSSSSDLFMIQQQLTVDLKERINYNEKLTQQFHKLIKDLREGQIELSDDDLSILSDLRYITLKGRNLNSEDFLELLKLRQYRITQNCLDQIITYLFPTQKDQIIDEFNKQIAESQND